MVYHSRKISGPSITDAEGLDRAYEQGDAYTYGDTLFIAGSHTARDWFDDFTKIPAWGDLKNAQRYQQAEKALKANPSIRKVVGHSLGASVSLELQKNHPGLTSRTYGGPIWDPAGSDGKAAQRYRNWFDPVSVFDRSAKRSFKSNPLFAHAYDNIAKFKTSGKNAYGWTNPDGSLSINQ